MKVAVVRNRRYDGVISRFGQPCPETCGKRTVQSVIDALVGSGHAVALFDGDKTVLAELEKFISPDPVTGQPTGMVFNLAYGIQGQARYSHVPSMLEMAGIPYTSAGPLGHALALDKVIAKSLMRDAGIPTPRFQVLTGPDDYVQDLRFPLIVKPRHESTSYGLHLVRNNDELYTAVHSVVAKYKQQALVEEYVDGREIYGCLLGNNPVEILPLVEMDFGDRPMRAMMWDDKCHKAIDEPKRICPARVREDLAARLRDISLSTFRLCHCCDCARVDIRVDVFGDPFVLEINSMPSLGAGGSFVLAAREAGYDFASLVARILDLAHQRYFGVPARRDVCLAATSG